jgi:outer membrane protein, heavy metal efflux system
MIVFSTRRVGACLYFVTAVWPGLGWAQSPLASELGFTQALEQTLARSPELIARGYGVQYAAGQLEQARLRPNPDLNVTLQDALGTGDYRGLHSAETTVSLDWLFERGVRARIVDAAESRASLAATEVDLARLDVAAETARRYIVCLLLQARSTLAEEGVRQAEQTVAAVRTRVAATRAPEAEQARAEVELVRAEIIREDVEHELASAYRRLAAQWGDTGPQFATVAGSIATVPALEPLESVLARVEQNPEIQSFVSRQRLADAELRLAEARARPSWRISGGWRRYEATDDNALVGGITIPLATRDRNQGRIAAARADAARTAAENTATRVDVETSLFVLYQELKHDVEVSGRLAREVVPRIETALDGTRRGYEVGRYGYLELALVQSQLLDARNEFLEVAADAHRLVVEIERLTGVTVGRAVAAQ